MVKKRHDPYGGGELSEHDNNPEKPSKRLLVADAESQGSANRHPSAATPQERFTDRISLIRISRPRREESGLDTGETDIDENALNKTGHMAVDKQLQTDFVAEEPALDASTADNSKADDLTKAVFREARSTNVIKLPTRNQPVDPSTLPPIPPAN